MLKRSMPGVDAVIHEGKPGEVYNIGNSSPVELMDYIAAIEKALGMEAEKHFLPLQAGDVPATYADVTDLKRDVGYHPDTPVEEGVARFVAWYRAYYSIFDRG